MAKYSKFGFSIFICLFCLCTVINAEELRPKILWSEIDNSDNEEHKKFKKALRCSTLGAVIEQYGWVPRTAQEIAQALSLHGFPQSSTVAYTAVATFLLLKLTGAITSLRVESPDESLGLDLSLHNETGYNL